LIKTATAVVVAIVMGLALVGARPDTAVAAGGDPNTALLLQQIPSSLRQSCRSGATPAGTDAAMTCTPRRAAAARVTFLGFADPTAARARYLRDGDQHKIPRDTASDCFGSIDAESPFRTKSGVVGRVFCAHRDHSIEWTYGNVVARATGGNDNDLYTWWARLVDRTLDPTQQALVAQAPKGLDRTFCQDNGDTSVKCSSPAANVYIVKYTHYDTPDGLTTAYNGAIAAAKLTPNVPPNRTSKNVCSFDTTWGPAPTQMASGRVACFHIPKPDGTYHFIWTTGQTLVEASSPSLSDVTQLFKTFPAAGQTASF
jgi:hypothetical protein